MIFVPLCLNRLAFPPNSNVDDVMLSIRFPKDSMDKDVIGISNAAVNNQRQKSQILINKWAELNHIHWNEHASMGMLVNRTLSLSL